MKIMHLSDLHLGKNLNGFSLYEDQRHIHKQILQIAKEEAIDAVMIAGDVFDKSVPTNQAIQLFDEFLTSWAELYLPVFIISGNHDSAQRVAFGANLFKDNNIFISPIYDGKISHITLKDEHGNINFYLLRLPEAAGRLYLIERICRTACGQLAGLGPDDLPQRLCSS